MREWSMNWARSWWLLGQSAAAFSIVTLARDSTEDLQAPHRPRQQRKPCTRGTGGKAAGEKDVLGLLRRISTPLTYLGNPRRRSAALRTAFPRLPLVLMLSAQEWKVFGNNPPKGPGGADIDLAEAPLPQRLDQQGVQHTASLST